MSQSYRMARETVRIVNELDALVECEYGHLECSYAINGPCSDEARGIVESRWIADREG